MIYLISVIIILEWGGVLPRSPCGCIHSQDLNLHHLTAAEGGAVDVRLVLHTCICP